MAAAANGFAATGGPKPAADAGAAPGASGVFSSGSARTEAPGASAFALPYAAFESAVDDRLDLAIADATRVRGDAERLYLAAEGSLLAVLAAHSRLNALEVARVEIAATRVAARLDAMQARGAFGDAALRAACGGPRR